MKSIFKNPKAIFTMLCCLVISFVLFGMAREYKKNSEFCEVYKEKYCEDSTDKGFCRMNSYDKCMSDFK